MIYYSKKIFFILIRTYQVLLSPLLGQNCRYQPTCSHYAMEAINLFEVLKGTRLAIKRIIRCHPWGESGYDPINAKNIKRIRK